MISTAKILQPEEQFSSQAEVQPADDPHKRPAVEVIALEHYRRPLASDTRLNEIVYFPLTVDESLSADAQDIVKRSCGDSIDFLQVEPLLKKHQSKIWISMKAAAYGIALHAIILGLPSAELGPVTHITTALHNRWRDL